MTDDPGCTEDLGSYLSLSLSVSNGNLELSRFFVISWYSFHTKTHLCLNCSFLLKYLNSTSIEHFISIEKLNILEHITVPILIVEYFHTNNYIQTCHLLSQYYRNLLLSQIIHYD